MGPLPRAVTSWKTYEEVFIRPEGYVWDQARQEITSEEQSYAFLQAAWMGDREALDRVFAWTEGPLVRPDGLYVWQWPPMDGGYIVDANTATDADQDIAFALILASNAFPNTTDRDRAKELLAAIRHGEGIVVAGGWVPCAGNWAVADRIINFSYFLFMPLRILRASAPRGMGLGCESAATIC